MGRGACEALLRLFPTLGILPKDARTAGGTGGKSGGVEMTITVTEWALRHLLSVILVSLGGSWCLRDRYKHSGLRQNGPLA